MTTIAYYAYTRTRVHVVEPARSLQLAFWVPAGLGFNMHVFDGQGQTSLVYTTCHAPRHAGIRTYTQAPIWQMACLPASYFRLERQLI